ncbi:hypothetical protein AVEN_13811-1 [Araneus ventricosus]|uniref:Uncharacterized protein n=1 Tax=Araneus ventricosus TaxID=182803 RepID=A0A4Y2M982_ARAVE|nr:hypothetical protein AVEN_13811-1 [Araneus ventricosus]
MKPLRPNGEVSDLGVEGFRFEARFHRRSVVYAGSVPANSESFNSEIDALSLVWCGMVDAAPVPSSSNQNYEFHVKVASMRKR